MNTQQKRFEYKLTLCYLRAAWLRVVKFFGYRPQRMGKGGEWKKDSKQSEPIGDGKSFEEKFYPLVEKGLIDEAHFRRFRNLDALVNQGLLQTYLRNDTNLFLE